MKLHLIAAAFVFSASPALADASIQFSAYEGAPVIKTGTGGTKISKNGIDYWTSGEPPRHYQVIGMVTDRRNEDWDGGHAVGSPTIASKVKKAGGDAVIVQSQQDAGGGGGGGGFATGSFGFLAMGGSKTLTTMIAVKYLPDEPQQAAPPATNAP